MPQDADTASEEKPKPTVRAKTKPKDSSWQWFTTPPAIRRLFDRFPLQTYPANELPQRTAGHRNSHALYIFTNEEGANNGAPSFNPGCLKWQAFLRFQGIDFVTTSSTNHASPTGALPFLLPSASSPAPHADSALPVPSNRIQPWIWDMKSQIGRLDQRSSRDENSEDDSQTENQAQALEGRRGLSAEDDAADMRYEAYISLLDHSIRNAYLYSLYLSPPNFASIATPFYINPSSNNIIVRRTLSHQLRVAAESELLKQSPSIEVGAIHRDCDKAFDALSELLGENEYFFGERRPGLFDASVFAYTNVLLDDTLEWRDARIKEQLRKYQNLVEHRERIADKFFA